MVCWTVGMTVSVPSSSVLDDDPILTQGTHTKYVLYFGSTYRHKQLFFNGLKIDPYSGQKTKKFLFS